jgi:hypothetical protein
VLRAVHYVGTRNGGGASEMTSPSSDSGTSKFIEPRPPEVTFAVTCHGLDPDRVTEVTGITPTSIDDGGPLGGQVTHGFRIPTAWWTLSIPPDADRTIDDQLKQLIGRLELHADAIRALPDSERFVSIDVNINHTAPDWIDVISAEQLKRIAALGATLYLSANCETARTELRRR